MHQTVQNLIQIKEEIKEQILKNNIGDYEPNVIAVSKTFKIEHISHLIDFGHFHYGENKVCLLYTSPSPRDLYRSRMPSSA